MRSRSHKYQAMLHRLKGMSKRRRSQPTELVTEPDIFIHPWLL